VDGMTVLKAFMINGGVNKMRRPVNWDRAARLLKPPHCTKQEGEYYHFLDGVEAGADAILRALKKQGIHLEVNNE